MRIRRLFSIEMSPQLFNFHLFPFFVQNMGKMRLSSVLRKRFFSMNSYYLLWRNLASWEIKLRERRDICLHRLDEDSVKEIRRWIHRFNPASRREIFIRLMFYECGFRHAYIVRKKNGDPVSLQWLVYPFENPLLEKYYQGMFYPLHSHQVMIENAFTFPDYRGIGLLSMMTIRLARIARNEGYKSCLAYISADNIISLNEFMSLGFKIRKMIPEYKLFGKRFRIL